MKSALLEEFIGEGRELLDEASEGLLALERAPSDPDGVNRIFRAVHTLKGSSGLFEVAPLTDLLHVAEDLMVRVREGELPLTPELVDLLLESADAVRVFIDELDASEAIGEASAAEGRRLSEALSAALQGERGAEEAAVESPPVDLPAWIEDIPPELRRAEGPIQVFEYRPDPTCFFRGEDPLLTAAAVPGLRWRSVELDSEVATDDPFSCALILRGASEAPREAVEHALRYVEDELEIWDATLEPAGRAPKSPPGGEHASAEAAPPESRATAKVLKVDQAKVDRLMNLIGQLVVAKNGLPYIARRLEGHADVKAAVRELKEHSAVVDRVSRELQSAIMEVRMLPVSQVFQRFPRLVRDVSRKLEKTIELTMMGEDTRADKNVIEALSEPLVHLVRNALDHGIESPSERAKAGKPETGHIVLRARNENELVVITIEDDGRGLDPQILRERATRKGVLSPEEADALSDEDARMLIFAAGFSTKERASELSGRGVGMDVVRTTIEKVGGRVSLESEVGAGTTITLSLPLSMAVSHVMTVQVDGQLYGIGMDGVVETVRQPSQGIRRVKDREAFVLRERLVPLVRLRALLGLPHERHENEYGEEAVLVLRVGSETVGLVADEFGENMEVLARPLEGLMADLAEYSGSAVLGDGRLLLLLEMKELLGHVCHR